MRQAIIASITFYLLNYFYLLARYSSNSLSLINKATGYTAVYLACLTLILGPLGKGASRKQLGLAAFVFGVLHTVISLFFIPSRFTMQWYLEHWIPIGFGLVAIAIWIWLAFISTKNAMKKYGPLWRKLQSYGARVAFFAITLHVLILKYQEIQQWYQGKLTVTSYLAHPTYPPGSLFIFVALGMVLLYRKLFFK